MGRFKPKGITIRKLKTGVKIYFIDSRTIYVANVDGFYYVFHRWDVRQRNFYTKNWHEFYKRMRQYKDLDIYKAYRLANRYDISRIVSVNPPQLEGKEIKEL